MFNKFSNVFKTKSFDIKDKLKDYINLSNAIPAKDDSKNPIDLNKKLSMK